MSASSYAHIYLALFGLPVMLDLLGVYSDSVNGVLMRLAKQILVVGGLLLVALPSWAIDNCGHNTSEARGFLPCDPAYPVDASVFETPFLDGDSFPANDAFTSAFTVYTCYPLADADTNEYLWDKQDLRAFAWMVLNPDSNEPDLALDILDFAAENVAVSPQWIAIPDGPSGPRTAFEIHIQYDVDEIGATASQLSVEIGNGVSERREPDEVALSGFVHEWQHVCHKYYARDGYSAVNFGGQFDEMCSVLCEWVFGLDGLENFGGGEVPYDRSFITADDVGTTFHPLCMCKTTIAPMEACCPYAHRHPYVQLSLFSIGSGPVYDCEEEGFPSASAQPELRILGRTSGG